jgi:hypothetical protein
MNVSVNAPSGSTAASSFSASLAANGSIDISCSADLAALDPGAIAEVYVPGYPPNALGAGITADPGTNEKAGDPVTISGTMSGDLAGNNNTGTVSAALGPAVFNLVSIPSQGSQPFSFQAHIGDVLSYGFIAEVQIGQIALISQQGNADLHVTYQIVDTNATVTPTSPQWDKTQGGVDFGYLVSGGPVARDTEEALYWSATNQLSGAIGGPVYTVAIPQGTAVGSYGFNVPASALVPPPQGAKFLLTVTDPNNVLGNFDPSANVSALAYNPTVTPTSLQWDTALGGVDYAYQVSSSPVLQNTEVALYWSSTNQFSGAMGGPVFTSSIPAVTALGSYGPFNVPASALGSPPPGAQFLLAVTDPNNALDNFDPNQNVLALGVLNIVSLQPPDATEGQPFSGPVAVFTDQGASAGGLTASVSWGDGSSDTLTAANGGIVANGAGTFLIAAAHTYAEEGKSLPFSVQVTDAAGVSASTAATIDVADAPLTIQALTPPANATEGVDTGPLALATFSDTNPKADISDLSATITWGDGYTDTVTAADGGIVGNGSTFAVVGDHAYAEEGKNLPFAVQVTDAGGAPPDSAAGTVNVSDAMLAVDTLTPTFTEGVASGPIPVATFTDDNSNPDIGDYTATVTWGDGTTDTLTAANGGIGALGGGTFAVQDSHLFPEEVDNLLPFAVQVVDAGGASDSAADTIDVVDAPLTFQLVAPPPAVEGVDTGMVPVATFRDANTNPDINDYTATIFWGDGTSSDGSIVDNHKGTFVVLAGHTYAEEGGYIFSVLVSDAGGSVIFTSLPAAVADAPLTVTKFAPPRNAVAGQSTGTLTVATFTDANSNPDIADLTATVRWGDGTTDTLTSANGGIQASGSAFAVVDAHTYSRAYAGIPFAVTITDLGGSSASTSATINVGGGSGLVITQFTPPSPVEGRPVSATLAVFTDTNVGPDPTHLIAKETFGDGTSAYVSWKNGGIVKNADGSFAVLLSHTYREESAGLTLTLSITDGKATAATSAVLGVADAPLSVQTLTPPAAVAGRQFSSTLLTFTDGNGGPDIRDFTAVASWGDGSTSTLTSANGGLTGVTTFSVIGTHTSAQVGSYTLSIQVLDVGGSATSTAAIVHINPRGLAPVPRRSLTSGQDDGTVPIGRLQQALETAGRQALPSGDTFASTPPLLTPELWTAIVSQLGRAGADTTLPAAASAPSWDVQGLTAAQVPSSFLLQNDIFLGFNQAWMTRKRGNGVPGGAVGQD